MKRRSFVSLMAAIPVVASERSNQLQEIPSDVLEDKIRGGFLGQVIGDLNGLQHEMKYILEPGIVERYARALPDGAWTDDDTDIEWPYILEIQRTNNLLIPRQRISTIWKEPHEADYRARAKPSVNQMSNSFLALDYAL